MDSTIGRKYPFLTSFPGTTCMHYRNYLLNRERGSPRKIR
uniref:Uncharacterized protein n=1 Tax=Picea glauca TaxID=3330 RepID=A0A124GMX4_PICGL|nr:hypothetical protein ABT39_MTgene6005 [Picea glauca]